MSHQNFITENKFKTIDSFINLAQMLTTWFKDIYDKREFRLVQVRPMFEIPGDIIYITSLNMEYSLFNPQ